MRHKNVLGIPFKKYFHKITKSILIEDKAKNWFMSHALSM